MVLYSDQEMIPAIDEDVDEGDRLEFLKKVKFRINQKTNGDDRTWPQSVPKVEIDEELLSTNANSSDESSSDVELDQPKQNSLLVLDNRKTATIVLPMRNHNSRTLGLESSYQRSLSPSPNPSRRGTIPYMDDGEVITTHVATNDDMLRERLKKFNSSIRSTASSYLNVAGEQPPTWADSDEAKSSLICVLSALYAMLLVILSLAFEVSIAVVKSIDSNKYDFFYIYLYSMALLFFAYCEVFLLRALNIFNVITSIRRFFNQKRRNSSVSASGSYPESQKPESEMDEAYLRKRRLSMSLKRRASHSASSAGSLYLRMGCVVFGVIGLIMKGLQLFAAFDRRTASNCFSASWVAETVLAAVFIFFQMFFIFQNSKESLIIHRFKTIGRLGIMHLVATNLSIWIRCLVEEHVTIIHEINHKYHDGQHDHQKDEKPDPTNITNSSHIEICASISVRYGANKLIADVEPFMTTCLIEYSLICAAVMYILWRNIGHIPRMRVRQRKQRFHVDCTASTQGLFMGLLFMVYTIVSMVIFFTKIRSGATQEALCVFYIAYIVLFSGSIAALAIGMYRMRRLFYIRAKKNNILLDDILLIVGLVGQLIFCIFSVVPMDQNFDLTTILIHVSAFLRMVQVLWQTVFIFYAQRLATLTPEMQAKNVGRELVTFLLMTNLALFLVNTFETHKAGTIPHVFDFDGEAVWMVISHSTIPLCIFYRFHSTVCLAEIWKQVYRVKTSDAVL